MQLMLNQSYDSANAGNNWLSDPALPEQVMVVAARPPDKSPNTAEESYFAVNTFAYVWKPKMAPNPPSVSV